MHPLLPATISFPQLLPSHDHYFPQSVPQPHQFPWALPNFPHISLHFLPFGDTSCKTIFPPIPYPLVSNPRGTENCIFSSFLPVLQLETFQTVRPHPLHLLHFPPLYCNLGSPTSLMDVSTFHSLLPFPPSSSLLPYHS